MASLPLHRMKYQIRDIVQAKEEFGNRLFAIIGINKAGYSVVEIKSRKRYTIDDSHIHSQVDRLPSDSPLLLGDEYNEEEAKQHCRSQARRFPQDAEKWKYLEKLVPGDVIRVAHRNFIHRAEFVRLNLKKQKYPIRAKIDGLACDFSLLSLIL